MEINQIENPSTTGLNDLVNEKRYNMIGKCFFRLCSEFENNAQTRQ